MWKRNCRCLAIISQSSCMLLSAKAGSLFELCVTENKRQLQSNCLPHKCGSLILFSVLIFFITISFVKAGEIEVNLPEKVKINEEFKVEINLINFSDGVYDAKIDILGNGQRIAQIKDIEWKSTYYFVKDVFENDKAELSLKVIKSFDGKADIIIKIRSSKGTTTTFEGYELEVYSGNQNSGEENINNEEIEEKNINTREADYEESIVKDNIKTVENNIKENISLTNNLEEEFQEVSLGEEREIIMLTPQNIKNEETQIIFKSKNELIKEYSLYGFIFFCITIIILLLIDRKKLFGKVLSK